MTELEQLCRDVWREVVGGVVTDEGIYFDADRITCDPLALTWDDAGRVVEAMRGRGLVMHTSNGPDEYGVAFSSDDEAEGMPFEYAPTFPEAVYRAALQAVRQENDNG